MFIISASEAKRVGCNPAEEKKRVHCKFINVFCCIHMRKKFQNLFSVLWAATQLGGAKREVSLQVVLSADHAAFQGCLCNNTGKII